MGSTVGGLCYFSSHAEFIERVDNQKEGRGAGTAREMVHIVKSLLPFEGICTKNSCKHPVGTGTPQRQFRRAPGNCYPVFLSLLCHFILVS